MVWHIARQFQRLFGLLAFLSLSSGLQAHDVKARTLFKSLNPSSVSQQLAFYELYPDSEEGKMALKRAWKLLTGEENAAENLKDLIPNASLIEALISLVNQQPHHQTPHLSDDQLAAIEKIASRLENRKLKGQAAASQKELLALPSAEIDLARAVLLLQADPSAAFNDVRSYEAMIDLMALQILTKVSPDATPQEKIAAINAFVFHEMGFRFPPHSLYADNIDLYTFLPAVLDSRHGVCLGVSILYLSLAQRLGLHLEIVTPPGHIYVRYKGDKEEINIETTARGIHLESQEYLGIDTKGLQTRTIKEVIGLAEVNYASIYLKKEQFEEALKHYQKALPFLPEDPQLIELMGYCHLFLGKHEQAAALLQQVLEQQPSYKVSKSTLAIDYLSGKADVAALKALFLHVDETRESILMKKAALEEAVARCPHFREGWESLGTAWLQLHRAKEALDAFQKRRSLDSNDPTVEYYLSALYASRWDYEKAWEHLKAAEELTTAANHFPKALKELRRELSMIHPE